MQELINYLGMKFDYTRELMIVGLILGRTMPMVFMTPFLVGQQAPPEVKMGLGVVLTIVLWPLAHDSMSANIPMDAMPFLLLMLKETFIGFSIGYASSHLFSAMEIAGRMIDTARGASMSEVLVPQSKSRATPIGTLYYQLLLIFFVLIGGHQVFIETFFYSFAALPLNEGIDLTPGLGPLAHYCIETSGEVLLIATILAAPSLAAVLITDMVFGILNRVAPQLNAYFMAMPVKAMSALALVLICMPPFFDRLEHYIASALFMVQKTIDLLMVR